MDDMKLATGFGEGEALECPRCGGNNLHQGHIEIFERGEDANTCFEVVLDVNGKLTAGIGTGDRNPSRRRHGMRILMSCEGCDYDDDDGNAPAPLFMAIVQHKGCTYIYWED